MGVVDVVDTDAGLVGDIQQSLDAANCFAVLLHCGRGVGGSQNQWQEQRGGNETRSHSDEFYHE